MGTWSFSRKSLHLNLNCNHSPSPNPHALVEGFAVPLALGFMLGWVWSVG